MNILDSITNFLELVNDNWTSIVVIIGLVLAITKKAVKYFRQSDAEKIEIIKKQIQAVMLKLITDAEKNYAEWKQSGSIKRAQVIEKLFYTYPILSKITEQEELIAWIDQTIDEALVSLRETIAHNEI